jgi:hypothetical protein
MRRVGLGILLLSIIVLSNLRLYDDGDTISLIDELTRTNTNPLKPNKATQVLLENNLEYPNLIQLAKEIEQNQALNPYAEVIISTPEFFTSITNASSLTEEHQKLLEFLYYLRTDLIPPENKTDYSWEILNKYQRDFLEYAFVDERHTHVNLVLMIEGLYLMDWFVVLDIIEAGTLKRQMRNDDNDGYTNWYEISIGRNPLQDGK